ncbi:uncharacterized protein EI90DRAFT_198238 [Cantharellus anzutake]|uniref:uncharacterized protein n=1 Tax=Cantharellus anzutake TaxID=1750568 RepID=UPI001906E791|nr:uncharacterized protein EI90DRAFT_198238 [Cantharellus anzutake]KAF8336611.1 hypothetical protein EI90DRAFT_198238 [Cantharellus anzutake]
MLKIGYKDRSRSRGHSGGGNIDKAGLVNRVSGTKGTGFLLFLTLFSCIYLFRGTHTVEARFRSTTITFSGIISSKNSHPGFHRSECFVRLWEGKQRLGMEEGRKMGGAAQREAVSSCNLQGKYESLGETKCLENRLFLHATHSNHEFGSLTLVILMREDSSKIPCSWNSKQCRRALNFTPAWWMVGVEGHTLQKDCGYVKVLPVETFFPCRDRSSDSGD